MKSLRTAFLLTIYGLVPAAVTAEFAVRYSYLGLLGVAAAGAGIVAYFVMGSNLALSARLGWMQRLLPYDAAVAAHAATGPLLGVSVSLHAAGKVAVGLPIPPSAWLLTVLVIGGLALARAWKRARKPGAYDRHKRVHRLIFWTAMVVTYVHVVAAGLTQALGLASQIALHAWFAGPVLLALIARLGTRRLRVTSVERLGDVAVLHAAGNKRASHAGGQYAYLSLGRAAHPFSFRSLASDDEVTFAFPVRGPFTTKLAELQVGAIAYETFSFA